MSIVTDAASVGEHLRRLLCPGDHIVLSQAAAEPQGLVEALVAARSAASGGTLLLATRISSGIGPEVADHLALVGLGGYGTNRALADAGVLEVVPTHLSQFARAVRRGERRVDVALVQVSEADAAGRHSLGVDASYTRAAIDRARVVVAEVNAQMPPTRGHRAVPTEDLDLVVPIDRPLPQMLVDPPSEIERLIGGMAADLVPDGATLQIGIGAVPRAVCRSLRRRRGLRVHTGLLDDAQFSLIEHGAAIGDEAVTGTVAGSRRLYDAVTEAGVQVLDAEWTHGVDVLARLPRFTAVNSALEIDLTGQVNAEVVGGRSIGAVAGLADFVRAAALSDGGRSILVLPSTAREGRVSRIVSRLEAGVVTVPRSDVDLVVTEYGVARLRGCTTRERAARLRAIAHPEHRGSLDGSLSHDERRVRSPSIDQGVDP